MKACLKKMLKGIMKKLDNVCLKLSKARSKFILSIKKKIPRNVKSGTDSKPIGFQQSIRFVESVTETILVCLFR